MVGVLEPSIDHAFLAEAVHLLVNERAHFAVTYGAREAPVLQADHLQHACGLVVADCDGGAVVHDLGQLPQLGVLVEHTAASAQAVDGLGSAILAVVVDDGGVALRRVVGVSDVADRHVRVHGVAGHAGHGDSRDPTRTIKLKYVLPLALQEQHHRLKQRGRDTCIK